MSWKIKAILASCAHSSQSEASANSICTSYGPVTDVDAPVLLQTNRVTNVHWTQQTAFQQPQVGLMQHICSSYLKTSLHNKLSMQDILECQVCFCTSLFVHMYKCRCVHIFVKSTHMWNLEVNLGVSFLARELYEAAFAISLAVYTSAQPTPGTEDVMLQYLVLYQMRYLSSPRSIWGAMAKRFKILGQPGLQRKTHLKKKLKG